MEWLDGIGVETIRSFVWQLEDLADGRLVEWYAGCAFTTSSCSAAVVLKVGWEVK